MANSKNARRSSLATHPANIRVIIILCLGRMLSKSPLVQIVLVSDDINKKFCLIGPLIINIESGLPPPLVAAHWYNPLFRTVAMPCSSSTLEEGKSALLSHRDSSDTSTSHGVIPKARAAASAMPRVTSAPLRRDCSR
jgi:hypothetical protein